MNENDLRVIKTKSALHKALLVLLKNNALEEISVSALCREAGVNRGTFYLHYKEVSALFDEHLRQLLNDLEQSFYEPIRQTPRLSASELDPSTIRIFHHVKKYQPFYEIVFDKKSSLSYYYSLFNKIKALLQESVASASNSADYNDFDFMLSYQANAIMGLLIGWSGQGFAASPDYMSQQLANIVQMKAVNERK
ncbi:TetR family transcriptional regulator [Paenibacillus montaniterrae]|uniref:TetR family transcriptional regulator n=1 Tax=Paenibacillus montaniterrae TaxID=429341 RepID=A0A920CYG4_9BACL|nr:TetR-like C-terminal domain-containing protein [Paenibacillus montaniterrae]GIP16014.1 TetR family transcriptional regulator [Paenibacillus montaniterrae]